MIDSCIVSLANNAGNYLKSLDRLKKSIVKDDFIGFVGEESIGAPLHRDNPYAFKVYAIEEARGRGNGKVLWVDSSCFFIKDSGPIWEEIKKDGFIMQYAGHNVGTWCNDRTLDYFGITRDEAMGMPMYGNAGFLGLDFETKIANEFFECWRLSMLKGMFKGAWDNKNQTESKDPRCKGHRHDMVCGSIIANLLGMNEKYKKGDEWLQYAGPNDPVNNSTIIIKAQGL